MLSCPTSASTPVDFSHRYPRLCTGAARLLAGIILGAVASTAALAQVGTLSGVGGVFGAGSIQIQAGGASSDVLPSDQAPQVHFLKLAPTSVTVDAKAHTAAIQFTNKGADTVHAALSVQDVAPGSKETNAQSLAAWIQDLPKEVVLAPHETRTVTLHLKVPSGLTAGDYSAYVVAEEQGVKLVYHAQTK